MQKSFLKGGHAGSRSCSGRGGEYVLFGEKTREGPSGHYHPLWETEDDSQFQEGEVPNPTLPLHQRTQHIRGRR